MAQFLLLKLKVYSWIQGEKKKMPSFEYKPMTQEEPMKTSNPLATQMCRIKLSWVSKQNLKHKPGKDRWYW